MVLITRKTRAQIGNFFQIIPYFFWGLPLIWFLVLLFIINFGTVGSHLIFGIQVGMVAVGGGGAGGVGSRWRTGQEGPDDKRWSDNWEPVWSRLPPCMGGGGVGILSGGPVLKNGRAHPRSGLYQDWVWGQLIDNFHGGILLTKNVFKVWGKKIKILDGGVGADKF